jgi:hypothetical protein
MTRPLTGGCNCGAVRYEVSEPLGDARAGHAASIAGARSEHYLSLSRSAYRAVSATLWDSLAPRGSTARLGVQ